MIVWGSAAGGGSYDPATDTWSSISSTNAPNPHSYATAVWTGTEMIIWGGTDSSTGNPVNDGAGYNPSTNTWKKISSTGAPSARLNHTAVWTGSQMLVAGGWDNVTVPGGFYVYDPQTDAWSAWSSAGGIYAQRYGNAAVWTGSAMIIWGGTNSAGAPLNTGTRFDLGTQSVLDVSTTGAPVARTFPSAVWTGTEMIVWGGYNDDGPLASGGRYNPKTNTWQSMPDAPLEGRYSHTAIWTNSEMIVWGGQPNAPDSYGNGARYSPASNKWTAVSMTGSPTPRTSHTAVWTGLEMIVWGGTQPRTSPFNTGGRYAP